MTQYEIQLLETLIVVIVYVSLFFVAKTVINNVLKNAHLQRARRKIIVKAIQLFVLIAVLVLLAGIWGLKQNEIAVFASTLLTALGIAFFAQWSLLSNITSSVILFFNHPLKLGDVIKVLDKDYPFEGEITELNYFFIHLETKEGDIVTIPNSIILQKSIAIVFLNKERK
ncbi:MAG: mechanosensitive ion channel family protein [Sphingobacteriaceae bacterium]|nr:mechanosensitive ion channel family protein [Sphingobacteriaceae bacterium]